uniref:30S ribosomal protein S5 n=1 Tax=Nephromyces sp. ex Molgula occidentalis TaxID=2544991 RepID=A0A5C1H7G6_9APIC|nr:30S ribosomal protein S5 [Nephromyces sp. ex Molgula occidentalis]
MNLLNNIKNYVFSKKNKSKQKLISYFLVDYNFNIIDVNYKIFKHLVILLLNFYIYKKPEEYLPFIYLFFKYIYFKVLFDILKLINIKLKTEGIPFKNKKYNINTNFIKYKILDIKKISKTTKKGRTKKFKVICASGNFSGWFGIGKGKDIQFLKAIDMAYKNSLNNIYILNKNSLKNFNNNYNFFIKTKASSLLINSKLKNGKGNKGAVYLKNIFELAGFSNITTKIIGSNNKLNTINALLKTIKINNIYNNKETLTKYIYKKNPELNYIINSLKLLKY